MSSCHDVFFLNYQSKKKNKWLLQIGEEFVADITLRRSLVLELWMNEVFVRRPSPFSLFLMLHTSYVVAIFATTCIGQHVPKHLLTTLQFALHIFHISSRLQREQVVPCYAQTASEIVCLPTPNLSGLNSSAITGMALIVPHDLGHPHKQAIFHSTPIPLQIQHT